MKYLKKFNNITQYNSFKNSAEYEEPNVSFIQSEPKVEYKQHDHILTFTALEAGSTVQLTKNGSPDGISLEYLTNGGNTYNSYTIDQTITLSNIGDSVKFRGNNSTFSKSASAYYKFVMSGSIRANGDITSLLNSIGGDCTLSNYCFNYLFDNCTSLVKAPALPSTNLANYCYYYMFRKCTGITQAPSLPATIMKNYCYCNLFSQCTNLTKVPDLPATQLADSCYKGMFDKCINITHAQSVLPATTLAQYCYSGMFSDCTSLILAPKLPATYLVNQIAYCCYADMFKNCKALIQAPDLPATTLCTGCYSSMFYGCTSLTQPPVLPATTLASQCYDQMFKNCSNLNYIKAMFTSFPDTNYIQYWLSGVSSTGTFVKNSAATWDVMFATQMGVIPEGWTVETAAA